MDWQRPEEASEGAKRLKLLMLADVLDSLGRDQCMVRVVSSSYRSRHNELTRRDLHGTGLLSDQHGLRERV